MPLAEPSDEVVRPPWAHLRVPPFPQIAVRILQLADQADVSMRQLSDLISADPAFSGEVLTIVNSALYASRSPIHSILQAVALLGTDRLKGVCLTVGVRAYLGKSLNHQSLRAIWRHSLACGLIAEQLARAGSMSRETAYTAGVMHDIGRLALAVIRPKAYADLLTAYCGPPGSILRCERDLFGFDHCEAGRNLVADWKMPADLVAVISDHHSPQSGGLWRLPDLIKISCRMADSVGFAVFADCETTPFAELLNEIPELERRSFCTDLEMFTFEVSSKINTLEMMS